MRLAMAAAKTSSSNMPKLYTFDYFTIIVALQSGVCLVCELAFVGLLSRFGGLAMFAS
jgi:hypothetical protein